MSKAIVQTTGGVFSEIVEAIRLESPLHAENIDPVDPGIPGTRFYLLADHSGGFGVTADGEVKYVFSVEYGQGDHLVSAAVRRGGVHLNCFEGHLSNLYARHGFSITSRLENWDPTGPDVVTMHRN